MTTPLRQIYRHDNAFPAEMDWEVYGNKKGGDVDASPPFSIADAIASMDYLVTSGKKMLPVQFGTDPVAAVTRIGPCIVTLPVALTSASQYQ